ncbi:MAG: 3-deoxy-D-manno-octulosonic acid transferase [Bacteroidaceae bacterium]|nr:3-deoxy-D-manno-octulosonic acid transferase [Candidatus Minthousia equi]MCQ2246922.1 3-deoxy-D-manno-octulosonic acid transferase [Bacteroidaceae bacterium]
MLGIYSIAICFYLLGVRIAALFSKKVALMVKGHKQTFKILKEKIVSGEKYVWFHAASLGEFEQGRPLMERLRKEHPEYKILLTFFSPSGYEVRKNYDGADVICYLPLDTPLNARRFVKMAHPVMAFFIKYEFWQNYMKALQGEQIPTYSVSSIFRKEQIFFRWYGGTYYKVLTRITHFFVQNEESKALLATRGITAVTVVGDTRFDRVIDIANQAKKLPLVETFKSKSPVFVAGSSWEPDEDLFIRYFNEKSDWKLIIAPHVVSESHIKDILSKLKRKVVRYTQANEQNVKEADCLIIDCYGLLSSIYRYGEIAHVGGGFGVGIHNVLEAAVYGIPVFFGPNNKRFQEAQQLLACKGGWEVTDWTSYTTKMDALLYDEEALKNSGKASEYYVKGHSGAADIIYSAVFG